MSDSVLKLKFVLKVPFYFPACLLESEFRAQLIWPPKNAFSESQMSQKHLQEPTFSISEFFSAGKYHHFNFLVIKKHISLMARHCSVLDVTPPSIDHTLRPANQRKSTPPEKNVISVHRNCVAENFT